MEDDFFDLDFDIDSTPIQRFLQNKLEEIKLENAELENQIEKRKALVEECVKKVAKEFNENVLSVSGIWKKVLNDKLIIGIQLENSSKSGFPTDVEVVLKLNSSQSLTYKSKLFGRYKLPQQSEYSPAGQYAELLSLMEDDTTESQPEFVENEWVQVDEIAEKATLAVVFSLSDVMEKLDQNTMNGIITFSYKSKVCQLELENLEILVSDFYNELLTVKAGEVVRGMDEAYLSHLVAGREMELIVGMPNNFYGNFESMLEFECRFRKCSILTARKKFFYLDGVASLIDGAFLVVQKESESIYKLSAYMRNSTELYALIHYISKNISNIIILPIKYKPIVESRLRDEFQQESSVATSILKQFAKCLENQIEFVEKFCEGHLNSISAQPSDNVTKIELNVNNEDYQIFRNRLSDLELNADVLFAEIRS